MHTCMEIINKRNGLMEIKLQYNRWEHNSHIRCSIDDDEWVIPTKEGFSPVALAKGLKQLYYILMHTYGGTPYNPDQMDLFENYKLQEKK